MKPERFTRVTWVMVVFLGTAAIVFDDPSFSLAAFSLVLFSAALALRFRLRMHRIITSARVTRSADRKIMLQGSSTAITTFFSCSPVPGTAVWISDRHPPTVFVEPGNATAAVALNGTATMRYRFTPLVPGSIEVTGIVVTVSDLFYTATLVMASGPFRGPELKVHPYSAFERSRRAQDFDEREKDAHIIYRGSAIRSVREYLHGDDLRFIDWKMTAKHNRMFIREYTTAQDVTPLIVLDLPDRSFPVPEDLMEKLVNSVTGEAVNALRSSGSVSLFLISGVNIIDIVLNETDFRRITMMIRTSAHQHIRLNHAYRWKNRAGIRESIRKIESATSGTEEESGRFLARIAQIYRRNLANPTIPVFFTQVQKLLQSRQIEEILLYSLFVGDISHVREISSQAQRQRIRLKLRTVAGQDAEKFSVIRRTLGMNTFEVMP